MTEDIFILSLSESSVSAEMRLSKLLCPGLLLEAVKPSILQYACSILEIIVASFKIHVLWHFAHKHTEILLNKVMHCYYISKQVQQLEWSEIVHWVASQPCSFRMPAGIQCYTPFVGWCSCNSSLTLLLLLLGNKRARKRKDIQLSLNWLSNFCSKLQRPNIYKTLSALKRKWTLQWDSPPRFWPVRS